MEEPAVSWDDFLDYHNEAMAMIEDAHDRTEQLLAIFQGKPDPSQAATGLHRSSSLVTP